jgi:long-chain acyl-CoA synthetase
MIDFRTIPSLPKLFLARAALVPDRPCLWAKGRSGWANHSYRAVAERFVRLAAGLSALGVAPGDRVALVAENRPDWVIADLAIMAAGAISVPAYVTNTVAEHRHILANAGATAAIVSTRALADKVVAAAAGTACRMIVAIESPEHPPEGLRLVGWADAFAAGEGREAQAEAAIERLRRTDVAAIIHTSGTGGAPRGATLSHGNILANCHGAYELLRPYGLEHEIYLSFLPLSHSYEHTVVVGFVAGIGAEIYMTEGAEHLARNLAEVRPTFTAGVPRLYETLHLRIAHQLERESAGCSSARWRSGASASPAGRCRWPTGCSTRCSTGWCATRCGRASAAGSRR